MAIKLPKKGAPEPTAREVFEAYQQEERNKTRRIIGKTVGHLNEYLNDRVNALQRSLLAAQAIDMVGLFSDPRTENDALRDWLNANRDSLTVEAIKTIIKAAMVHGLSEAMRQKQAPRTASRTSKEKKIRQEWQKLKAQGASKNSASKTIAEIVGLTAGTVRGKLQKM